MACAPVYISKVLSILLPLPGTLEQLEALLTSAYELEKVLPAREPVFSEGADLRPRGFSRTDSWDRIGAAIGSSMGRLHLPNWSPDES